MKKSLRKAGFFVLSLALLTGCGGSGENPGESNASQNESDKTTMAFTRTPYVDLSNLPEKFSFPVEVTGSITRVNIGTRIMLQEGDYSYENGILTINGNVFANEDGTSKVNGGVLKITVYADKTSKVECLAVNKILKTAQDLVDISKDIDSLQGAYILGNDIDCSSISNFEPIGYSDTQDGSHFGMQFNGVLDGNGYAIKNVTTKYTDDWSTNKSIYDGNPLFSDISHSAGNTYGVFQEIGTAGIVRNIKFSNISITGRTIVGAVCGLNQGTIENVLVDNTCKLRMSTHFYDESCALGGIVGMNGTGSINHCVSLATDLKIAPTYTDYDDVYRETDTDAEGNPVNYHTFYNGNFGEGKEDSNGKLANNIYSGVGLTYGDVSDSFGLAFKVDGTGLDADFSQTHREEKKPADGPNIGTITNCTMYSDADLKKVSTYGDVLDSNIWNLREGRYPDFKAVYPFEMK